MDYEVGNVLVGAKTVSKYVTDLDATLDLINSMPGCTAGNPPFVQGGDPQYRQCVLGVSVKAIKPGDEKFVSPLYVEDGCRASDLGEDDKGEVMIGLLVAGDATIKAEDEFQPSLGGVRLGPITIEDGNGYTKDYRVKGIYYTGRTPMTTMSLLPGLTWSRSKESRSISRNTSRSRQSPVYDEKFIKDELLQYGVPGYVQTTGDFLKKAMGSVMQSFAIINMVSLIVGIIITTVVLFIVITIKTINSRL